LERKRLIAVIIIAIIVVGGLGWYYFFGKSSSPPMPGPMLYVDGRLYNSTSITWNLNATPGAASYWLHNASNPTLGNASANAFFSYKAFFYNSSQSQWVQIYNGTQWLINTASLLITPHDAIPPFSISVNKANERSKYNVYINYTDQQINVKLQYLGNKPTVDGKTVFAYLGFGDFSNATSGYLDASNRAFNFTDNLNRVSTNMLQVYEPANATTWNATAIGTYSWNGTTLPSDAPVSVAITTDRKNITWTIPYAAIGAVKGKTIGVVIQAFGYNFYPAGATSTTAPTPSKYYKLNLRFPAQVPFAVSLLPKSSGTLTLLTAAALNRNVTDLSTYYVYINYTDQALNIKFQYPGNQPAVDGKTVFTYLGFGNATSGHLDASNRAFNFTNNPYRANASMLQEYVPANATTWNTHTANKSWSWNGANLPSGMPVSVAITSDRKNVTWTIPYAAIGAVKDSYIGFVFQAFSYDFFPAGTGTTPPTPNKYYPLSCLLPPVLSFGFKVQPATTVTFYLKVAFSVNATASTRYSFDFTATSPS